MIKLQISSDALAEQINNRILGLEELTKPSMLQEIAKAAYVITGEKFLNALDRYAVMNPKKMHHIYEWNQIGNPSARLFVLNRSRVLGGNLDISINFKPSRVPVPIPQQLLEPGKKGRFVSSRHIFRDKASVMESGRAVRFEAKRILTFLGTNGQVFLKPGTVVNILNPGGPGTKNALSTYMLEWYQKNTESVMDSSGLYEKIVHDVSLALDRPNAGVSEVRNAIINAVNQISAGRNITL